LHLAKAWHWARIGSDLSQGCHGNFKEVESNFVGARHPRGWGAATFDIIGWCDFGKSENRLKKAHQIGRTAPSTL